MKTAVFDTKQLTGVKVRTLLGLRSADFDISVNGNTVTFTCRGYGHGVGMSQYGANEMGKQGSTYSQIIKHYYTGVSILKK
ncbi:Amidase enhancer precursor [compost metagenome]